MLTLALACGEADDDPGDLGGELVGPTGISSHEGGGNGPSEYVDRFDHVDVTLADDLVEVIVFDVEANIVGVLRLWVDEQGDVRLTSEYDDGYGDLEFVTGTVLDDQSLPEVELRVRAEAVDALVNDLLGRGVVQEKNSWWKCGRWVAGTAVACYAAKPLACVGAATQAACTCVPKIIKEWEHMECPWNA